MRILRTFVLGITGLAAAIVLPSSSLTAQSPAGAGMSGGQMGSMDNMMGTGAMAGKMMTKEQKIANAMTAAPMAVAGQATILDWPAKEGEKPSTLRAGRNGWTCLPDMPQTQGSDPMCIDKSWMTWVDAYLAHQAPAITTVGIGYMMAPGGAFESNSDPYATMKTADNHWAHHAPHLMILVPDLKSLQGVSTDPANGGPYVMFAGTPYAHIMAPIDGGKMMGMTMGK